MIGGKFKHPRFKSRKSNDFSYREVMISENCFDFNHRTLNIPKLKKVKFKLRSLPKNFIIKSVKNITVKKTPSRKYFASLCCEVEYTESRYRHENQMSASQSCKIRRAYSKSKKRLSREACSLDCQTISSNRNRRP